MSLIRWFNARLIFFPTLFWNALLGRWLKVRNWWDPIDDHVILGAFPFSSDAQRLSDLGVTGVVNTCEEYKGPKSEYDRLGIEQFYMPTIDFTHPKFDDVVNAVGFIEANTANGQKTYIHCKAGRGRSATVAICWIMKSQGLTANAAQKYLCDKRPHINRYLPQRPVVKQFEAQFVNQN